MTLHDFLMKYGTRSVSIALRQSRNPINKEMADDLQAALENYITIEEMKPLTVHEVMMRGGGNGRDKG